MVVTLRIELTGLVEERLAQFSAGTGFFTPANRSNRPPCTPDEEFLMNEKASLEEFACEILAVDRETAQANIKVELIEEFDSYSASSSSKA